MDQKIRNTEPKVLWNHFADLNAIPRPSKKEARIVAFVIAFAKKHRLTYVVDEVQNVILKKPATAGMETRKTVVLQAHLDMVHQKNEATVFDFDKQGIQMKTTGDWISADGTTLGADNGIGVAAILSVLSATNIAHPALEALFTIDEETGMTGAMGLKAGLLTGEILLNLDTEDDDEISIGCAGGIDLTASSNYEEFTSPEDTTAFRLTIKGLQGGHSGMDIHKGFGNANKIIARILLDAYANFEASLASLKGGSLRNAIPRESQAILVVKNIFKEAFALEITQQVAVLKKELSAVEPDLEITLTPAKQPEKVMDVLAQKKLIQVLYATHNGVYAMSPSIPDLVETSNNLAQVNATEGRIEIACLTRSFSESGKMDMANALRCVFELADFKVTFSGDYPGWEPDTSTEILKILKELYEKLFQSSPKVMACHAGLECGILGTHYPSMEMISFGPNIRGAHSPEEKVSISSTQKFWTFFKEILKNIPKK
jgi:dipeptidase D